MESVAVPVWEKWLWVTELPVVTGAAVGIEGDLAPPATAAIRTPIASPIKAFESFGGAGGGATVG